MPAELDTSTVQRAQRGNRAAQETFLRRYVGPMHALIRRSGAPGDADDLTQELLQKLLAALPRFRPAGAAQLTTWVFTVAQHWLIDVCRRRHLSLAPLDEGHEVPDHTPGADELLERHELTAAIEQAIESLPMDQRRMFVLAHVHQRPLQEIAAAEGVPVGTIKSRLHRARVALVTKLGETLDQEGGRHGATRRA